MRFLKNIALLLVVVAAIGATGFAQGPLQKRMNFTINVPYRLRMQNYMLPAGNYILHQVSQQNSTMYALYDGDMRHSPIALIQTVRVNYMAMRFPDKTAIHWHIDETNVGSDAVVSGWDIPGEDGWQIVSVVPNKNGRNLLTQIP